MVDHQLPLSQAERAPLLAAYLHHLKVTRQKTMLARLEDKVSEVTAPFFGCAMTEANRVIAQAAVDDAITNWWRDWLMEYGPTLARIKFQMRVVESESLLPGYTLKYSPALKLLAVGGLDIPVELDNCPTDQLLLTWEKYKERFRD